MTAARGELAAIVVLGAALLLSLIDAPYPHDQRLQHVPTALALAGLAAAAVRGWLSPVSFYGLLAFLALHVIGARWVYSAVPYDAWAEAAFGIRPSRLFGWERNHYDRFVHFAFGGLALPAAAELFRRWTVGPPAACLTAGLALIAAVSGLYEVAEWQVAVWLAPDAAEAYNGQQGDMWDAQKDMALAFAGSFVTAVGLSASGLAAGRTDRRGSASR